MNEQQVVEAEARYGSGVYRPQPIALVRGEGARLWDADGREYIDCMSGHGVLNLGHAHPAVVDAVSQQAGKLWICPGGFCNDRRAELLTELVRVAPDGLERAFLCNSGTEAVEAALKFARIATGRTGIIAAMRGYHGRTMGALSATWNRAYRDPVAPLVPDVSFVPYNRAEPMDDAITGETAAVILEVVQGEGGVIPGDSGYLRSVESLCRERGALLILDEVQSGFGRTGRMFACEHHDLKPDLLCLAKSIAGGFPMGAVLIGDRVGQLPARIHGSTFGGNPLACAVALASLRTIEADDLPSRAAQLGDRLRRGLESIGSPLIRTVRGLGLMLAIELKAPAMPYLAALAEHGVLALAAGKMVMRFLPPLIISGDEVDAVIEAVAEVLSVEVRADG